MLSSPSLPRAQLRTGAQGPIRRGGHFYRRCLTPVLSPIGRGVWVPAQGRDDVEYCVGGTSHHHKRSFAFSPHDLREVCWKLPALSKKRAQERPGARRTRGLACKFAQTKAHTSVQVRRRLPAFPAQWFYVL